MPDTPFPAIAFRVEGRFTRAQHGAAQTGRELRAGGPSLRDPVGDQTGSGPFFRPRADRGEVVAVVSGQAITQSVALVVGGDVGLEATPAPTTDENRGRALGGTPASANCARTTVQSSMTVNKSGNSCTPQAFPGAIQILRSLQITYEMARQRHPLVDLARTDEQPVCFGQGQISGTTRYCARPNRTASKRRHGLLQVLGAVVIGPDVAETCGRKPYGQGINNDLFRFRKTVEKSVPVIVCRQTAADRIRTAER